MRVATASLGNDDHQPSFIRGKKKKQLHHRHLQTQPCPGIQNECTGDDGVSPGNWMCKDPDDEAKKKNICVTGGDTDEIEKLDSGKVSNLHLTMRSFTYMYFLDLA